MAIGQLVWNSELAQPHVAVFINSHPVHLDYQKAIKTIATRKSQNISAMSPGAVAVVNADLHESATVQAAALAHGLRLLTYGQGAGTDIRAISVSGTDGVVPVEIQGSRLRSRRSASGRIPSRTRWPSQALVLHSTCQWNL